MRRLFVPLLLLLVMLFAFPSLAEVPDTSGTEVLTALAVLSHPADAEVHVDTVLPSNEFETLELRGSGATVTTTQVEITNRDAISTRAVQTATKRRSDGSWRMSQAYAKSRFVRLC